MGVAKKYLLGAFGLLVTVALIYSGLIVFQKAKAMADAVSEGQDDAGRAIAEYDVMKYDGFEVSGSTAMAYIKTVVSKHGIPVEVTTAGGSFTCTDSTLYKEFRDMASPHYINPMARYLIAVGRDDNGVITKVCIAYVP